MRFVHFAPFEQMESLRRQVDQVFAEVESNQKINSITWSPAIGLLDDSDNLILQMELPGVDDKDIDIEVTRETVTVSGKRKQQDNSANYLYSELRYGNFRRHISLPTPIIQEKVKANFVGGILTLVLPKIEEAKNRVVKISLGDTTSPKISLEEAKSPEEKAEVAIL